MLVEVSQCKSGDPAFGLHELGAEKGLETKTIHSFLALKKLKQLALLRPGTCPLTKRMGYECGPPFMVRMALQETANVGS